MPGGDEIMPHLNALSERFTHVVVTQDWHLPGQTSFASTHGAAPFTTIRVPYGDQVLWPNHCVQGTPGADFHPNVSPTLRRAQLIVRKGHHLDVDSYSAFFENDRTTPTGLAGYLRERGFNRCVFAGLALDFRVRYSAEDARRLGFGAVVVEAATRAIDLNGSLLRARAAFEWHDVALVNP